MKLFIPSTLVLTALATNPPKGCNKEEPIQHQIGGTLRLANLHFLDQNRGGESPACLDGSKYGFYFAPSTTNSTKWTIFINGGGWCYDEVDCWCRSAMGLGTSKYLHPSDGCGCMNPLENGDIDNDCNCIYMPYSDGASFSGFKSEAVAVPGTNEKIYFRGIKNLDGVIDFAMANGMTDATEFVVTGGSAGGLSTFLHMDRFAGRLKAEAPKCKTIRGAPNVGYFLDHDNFKHTTGFPGGPNSPQWATPGTGANYTMWMKYIYTMQNLTFGADGGLTEACQKKHPTEPHLCFMSPHMNDVVETPFFMFNSKYDHWQLLNELQTNWTTADQQQAVLQYGKDFMQQLVPVQQASKNGAMITSCICHGCPWKDLVLGGKTSFQNYADWFYGKSAVSHFHIDSRLPNGGGTFTYPDCIPFPNVTANAVQMVK